MVTTDGTTHIPVLMQPRGGLWVPAQEVEHAVQAGGCPVEGGLARLVRRGRRATSAEEGLLAQVYSAAGGPGGAGKDLLPLAGLVAALVGMGGGAASVGHALGLQARIGSVRVPAVIQDASPATVPDEVQHARRYGIGRPAPERLAAELQVLSAFLRQVRSATAAHAHTLHWFSFLWECLMQQLGTTAVPSCASLSGATSWLCLLQPTVPDCTTARACLPRSARPSPTRCRRAWIAALNLRALLCWWGRVSVRTHRFCCTRCAAVGGSCWVASAPFQLPSHGCCCLAKKAGT